MSLFGLFGKNKGSENSNKSHDSLIFKNYVEQFLRDSGFYRSGNFEISIANSINLYQECSPFFMVVDKIVASYSEIPFRLYDKKNKKFIDNHDVLDLLNNPNPDNVSYNFKESLASMFLITGNSFLMATGKVNKPPLEIYTLSPLHMTAMTTDNNFMGFVPKRWQYSANAETVQFEAVENLTGIKYYNSDNRELYHVKRFNPSKNVNRFFGMSKSYPLFREMESYTAGNINNAALLKNGARPSVAWVNNRGEELTETQFERMVQEAKKFSGADNAGGTPILDGMDVKTIGLSNTDMQFKELQDTMLARIANVYGVPLALLLDSVMTLNNLQTARLHLDKDAVIPLAKRINQELTRFLLPRYKNSENLEFRIDLKEIESLKPEVLSNAKSMTDTGVNTSNEIRLELGYPPIEGGDTLKIPTKNSVNDDNKGKENTEDDEKSLNDFKKNMHNSKLNEDEIKALWVLTKIK